MVHKLGTGRISSRAAVAFPRSLVDIKLMLDPIARVWKRYIGAIFIDADIRSKIREDVFSVKM